MNRSATIAGLVGLIALSAGASVPRSDTPRPAQDIMSESLKAAKSKHRPVFVLFDASW